MNHLVTQRGFSLVELMIALVLGLLVMTGATTLLLSNQQSYRSNAALGGAQEGARIAFELLARDLRQAGLAGCGPQDRVFNALNNPTALWYTDLNNAGVFVRGYEGAPTGTGAPAPANLNSGADSIVIRGLDGSGLSVSSHAAPNVFSNQINTGYFQPGDMAVICDPLLASVVQVTSVPNTTTTTHTAGGSTTPGNSTAVYGRVYVNNAQIARLSATYWYIGENPRGGDSLYRLVLGSAAGNAVVTSQEMVRNVTDMQLAYLHPDAAGAPVYMDADDANLTDWSSVTAVRMTLRVEGDGQNTGTGGESIARTVTSVIGLRNRLN